MIRRVGSWSSTGSLGTARDNHTATLLPSGKVLVAGGDNFVALSSAELYDPATGAGAAPATSVPHVGITRRRCCPMARCWWRREPMIAVLSS